MKLIDRLFLIAFLFFALYFLYLPHLPGAYASALLAAVCSGCGYAALSHIFVRASAPRRLRRQNLQRGRAFVR
ncbi:MAG: hypothetical protein Q4A66_02690, partial [Eubacteriales bacterium]|nr:hypothetical protein [Eubacteriales bacterium]